MWPDYGVDSLLAYGDYYESTQFAYAWGWIESFYRFINWNQIMWLLTLMSGCWVQELYIKSTSLKLRHCLPHATSIGRSIAGNNLPSRSFE